MNEHPLVLGATGAQGGATVRALVSAGVSVLALVGDAAKAKPLADLGAILAVGTSTINPRARGGAVFLMQVAAFPDKGPQRRDGRNIIAAGPAQRDPISMAKRSRPMAA